MSLGVDRTQRRVQIVVEVWTSAYQVSRLALDDELLLLEVLL